MTRVLAAEHEMFRGLFLSIEKRLPRVKTPGEVRRLARLVEGLLLRHAKAENDLLLQAHAHGPVARQGHLQVLQEHHEINAQLKLVSGARTVAHARALLRAALAASRKHFASEDRVWFPLMEKVVEPETLRRLGAVWLLRHHCPANWTM